MTFSNDKPIYIQMADRLCDEILSGKYQDDDRIPSVREYAVLLEVNSRFAIISDKNMLLLWFIECCANNGGGKVFDLVVVLVLAREDFVAEAIRHLDIDGFIV